NLNHEQVTHTSSLSCSSRKGGVVPYFYFLLTAIHSSVVCGRSVPEVCTVAVVRCRRGWVPNQWHELTGKH
nr:hypothetical protein [Tanacetum cinerariifolium]